MLENSKAGKKTFLYFQFGSLGMQENFTFAIFTKKTKRRLGIHSFRCSEI